MSDLSFLIQNQNQVLIDSKFLEKCIQDVPLEKQHTQISDKKSRDIKMKKKTTFTQLPKQKNQIDLRFAISQNFYKKCSYDQTNSVQQQKRPMEYLDILEQKIKLLQINQQQAEKKIAKDLFEIQKSSKSNISQNILKTTLSETKKETKQTKQKIGQILSILSKKQ